MSGILLTAYSGAILGPIAKVLGWVMNGIYMAMYNLFGIEDVALSIILLTAVIYLCLLPLTIKQQKSFLVSFGTFCFLHIRASRVLQPAFFSRLPL